MITNQTPSTEVSPTIRRQARHEWELDFVVLDSVFQAREAAELQKLLVANVYADPRYVKLPKYRQIALEAYFRGAVDAISRMQLPAPMFSPQRPKTVPPKKGKNKPKRTKTMIPPPPLHPSNGAPAAPPPWASVPMPSTLIHSSP